MYKLKKLLNFTKNTVGDTIVEVIVVTASLGLVLVGTYTLSSRGLKEGISANERTEAGSIAQQQIEYIKDMYLNHPSNLPNFEPPNAPANFCIVSSGGNTTAVDATNAACTNYSNSFSVSDSYSGDPDRVFKVTVTWSTFTNISSTTTLYYKVP